jgi:threonine dehydrogenase-like Zn-dependent dehydrogenase
MRAVALDYEQRSLAAIDTAEPAAEEGELLIRVAAVGVCGTDRDLARFQFGYPPEGDTRLILGHEALGQVVSTGEWVVPTVRRACSPACASCARGRRDLCLSGRFRERGIMGAHGYFCDYAVVDAGDLVPVPSELLDVAVLAEPMSVVQKAVRVATTLHEGGARRAVVVGAGTIGILAALVLRERGVETAVFSAEEPGSARARLVESAGLRYTNRPDVSGDIVIEAAGAPAAVSAGLSMLAPLGVLVILGAPESEGALPLIDLIVGNRIVAGSVNSAPEDWVTGIHDLGRVDAAMLRRMLQRAGFEAFRESILGVPPEAPKIVHMIG